jgi:hypothetical protein
MAFIITPNILRSTYLHVRSKDGTQLEDTLNTNFSVLLASPVKADTDEVINISMISASIPHSFYDVSAALKNNTIVYDAVSTMTLPSQNYTPYELIRVLNADAAFSAIWTASYNLYTNKLTLTNITGVPHDLNWTSSTSVKVLGYNGEPDETVAGGASSTSSGMLDFATVHSIIVRCDAAQGNVLSTRSGQSTILQKINADANPYELIYLNATDISQISMSHAPSIDHMVFRLEDQNGNLIDLNNINYEFSLRFDVHQLTPNTHGKRSVPDHTHEPPPPPSTTITNPQPPPPPSTRRSTESETTPNQPPPPPPKTKDISHLAQETILDLLI